MALASPMFHGLALLVLPEEQLLWADVPTPPIVNLKWGSVCKAVALACWGAPSGDALSDGDAPTFGVLQLPHYSVAYRAYWPFCLAVLCAPTCPSRAIALKLQLMQALVEAMFGLQLWRLKVSSNRAALQAERANSISSSDCSRPVGMCVWSQPSGPHTLQASPTFCHVPSPALPHAICGIARAASQRRVRC